MKSPAFQFYAAEYLADEHVQLMTLEQEGIYIRLLAFCWREGSIPADLKALSMLCKGGSTTDIRVVLSRFKMVPENASRMVHTRLEVERGKQQIWREKSAKGGRASAHKRKKPKEIIEQQGGTTKGQPDSLNTSSSFSSSSSIASSISSSKKKTNKPRDTRLDHPAMVAIYETIGKYPTKDVWDSLIKTVGLNPSLDRMKECWVAWRTKNYSPTNMGWLVDWYVNGIPSNGHSGGKAEASVAAGRAWIEARRAQDD